MHFKSVGTFAAIAIATSGVSSGETLEDSVKNFLVSNHYNCSIEQIDLKQLQSGLTGNRIFLCDGFTDKPVIVKEFKKIQDIVSEEKAIRILKGLSLDQMQTVDCIAIQQFQTEQPWGLMEQSLAPGESMDQIIEQLGKSEGEERKTRFEKICLGDAQVGRGLAELHSHDAGCGYIDNGFIQGDEGAITSISNGLKNHPDFTSQISSEDFDSYLTLVSKAHRQNPGMGAFVHGDPQPGNLFLEETVNGDYKFTIIDNATLVRSLSDNEQGFGSPARDYFYFVERSAELAYYSGVTADEITQMTNAFDEAYRLKMGAKFPTDEAMNFYEARITLGILVKNLNNLKTLDPQSKEYQKTKGFIDFKIEKLKERIQAELSKS